MPTGHAGARGRARAPAPARRLRRPGAAGLGGHPRLHALRHLPAPVPDLPGARPGDGLAARARLPDARRGRGPHRPHRELRPPHGPLPRLSRVRDGVPGRRPVRSPHRGDARADRAEGAAAPRAATPGPAPPRRVPRAAAARAGARPDAALSALAGSSASSEDRGSSGASRGSGRWSACSRRSRPRPASRLPAETLPPSGAPRGTVALLEGCVQALLFPGVNRATVQPAGARRIPGRRARRAGVLRRAPSPLGRPGRRAGAGPAERRPPSRTRTGSSRTPRAAARRSATTGISSATTRGRRALAARVRDVTELLAEHLPGPRRPLDLTVTYHEPCHLAHGQRVREAPRDHPARDPGAPARRALRVRPLLRVRRRLQPHGARDRRDSSSTGSSTGSPATGAGVVASGNPGCLLQLRRGLADRGLAGPRLPSGRAPGLVGRGHAPRRSGADAWSGSGCH